MTDHPIIFSAPMVRALLEGRKSQTRRLLTPRNTLFDGGKWPNWKAEEDFQWDDAWVDEGPSPAGNPGPYLKLPVVHHMNDDLAEQLVHRIYPRIQPGDRLYVREAWAPLDALTHSDPGPQALADRGFYRADESTVEGEIARWRPSIHMPRWVSRLTLAVTEVRVQRLQDISKADAVAEGCDAAMALTMPRDNGGYPGNSREAFKDLWNSLHGPEAWAANPWVAAISFTVQRGNIDQVAA